MIPGEFEVQKGDIELNAGRRTLTVKVANSGDRPIQVGSHFHFFEVNKQMEFNNVETIVYSLNIEDIQTVSQQTIKRDLTSGEIEKIIDSISENINWFEAIESAMIDNLDIYEKIDSKDDDA